jgi:hypothetical protein
VTARRRQCLTADLEPRIGSFEGERDVLGLHVRHAHVLGRDTAIDRRDAFVPEPSSSKNSIAAAASATAMVM